MFHMVRNSFVGMLILSAPLFAYTNDSATTRATIHATTSALHSGASRTKPVDLPSSIPNGPDVTKSVDAKVLGRPQFHGYGAISFINAENGWIIGRNNVLLHTVNGGQSWSRHSLGRLFIQNMRFVSPTLGYAFALSDPVSSPSGTFKYWNVVRTRDGGLHWTVLYRRNVRQKARGAAPTLEVNFVSKNDMYVLMDSGIVSTVDGGRTWKSLAFHYPKFTAQSMNFTKNGVGWVAGTSPAPRGDSSNMNDRVVVLHTMDGGHAWKEESSLSQPQQTTTQLTFINRTDGWLLTTSLATMNDELFQTKDGGFHWRLVKDGLPGNPMGMGAPVFLDSNYGWIPSGMGAMPASVGVDVTHDGGHHFQLVGTQKGRSALDVALVNRHVGYVTGYNVNYRFVLKTTNGGRSFKQILPAYSPTQGVHFVTSHVGFGVGDASDANALLKSTDAGRTWRLVSRIPGSDPNGSTLTFSNSTDGWIVAQNQRNDLQDLYRTTDGGRSWSFASQLPGPVYVSNNIVSLRFWNATDGTLEISGNDGSGPEKIYETADGGRRWSQARSTKWAEVGWVDSWPTRNVIIGAVSSPFLPHLGEVMVRKSTDTGRKWQVLWRKPNTRAEISQVDFISPVDGWMSYAIGSKNGGNLHLARLLRTKNGGKTWTAFTFTDNQALSTPNIGRLDFVSPMDGWMLVQDGLLRTRDAGRTWTWIS